MEQNFNPDFTENTTNEEFASNSNSNNGVTAVKEKVTKQAINLRDKLNEQAKTYGTQLTEKIDSARGRTSAGLRSTSERMQNLALYMDEHDAKDMSDAVVRTSKELIRKNPGKSLLVGMAVGLLIGRVFSMGSHSSHHHRK